MKPASDRKKRGARLIANLAEEYGFIKKTPCEKCGGASDHKHHDDYEKPMEIQWLCRRCHIDLHVEERDAEIDGVIRVLERFR